MAILRRIGTPIASDNYAYGGNSYLSGSPLDIETMDQYHQAAGGYASVPWVPGGGQYGGAGSSLNQPLSPLARGSQGPSTYQQVSWAANNNRPAGMAPTMFDTYGAPTSYKKGVTTKVGPTTAAGYYQPAFRDNSSNYMLAAVRSGVYSTLQRTPGQITNDILNSPYNGIYSSGHLGVSYDSRGHQLPATRPPGSAEYQSVGGMGSSTIFGNTDPYGNRTTNIYDFASKLHHYQDIAPAGQKYDINSFNALNPVASRPMKVPPLGGANLGFTPISAIQWDQTPGEFIPQFSKTDKALAANQLFALTMSGEGPFQNTRVNMGGVWEMLGRDDPRYTPNIYANTNNDLYNAWHSGQITGSQLFAGAIRQSVQNDVDTLFNDVKFLQYDRKKNLTSFLYGTNGPGGGSNTNLAGPSYSFNSTGGGSISRTGVSFSGNLNYPRTPTFNFSGF